ncbi:MAG TPA: DUF6263 family protein [Chitinophagaceae bacterium]|nr:DUF6263 family protein [Chitinophagaceae bacterium]
MRKLTLLVLAILTMITITAIYSCKNSKTTTGKVLKFNLEKGKSYDYEILWDTDQKMMGQDNKITIAGGYTINVIDENDNIKTLTAAYRNFKMYMNIMGMEISVDTDKPSGPMDEAAIKANPLGMMDRVFAGIKGKEFTMKVDEEGKVLQVSGFEQIINGMIDSIGINDDVKMQMRASLQDQFNEQAIKDQFAQVFTIFPNKEIKSGDSWEKSFQMGGRMPAKYTTKYTVKEIEGDHVSLSAQTRIGSGSSEMEIKGTQDGSLLVDSKTGLVINAEFDQDMDIKARGMEIKIIGKGKIKGK